MPPAEAKPPPNNRRRPPPGSPAAGSPPRRRLRSDAACPAAADDAAASSDPYAASLSPFLLRLDADWAALRATLPAHQRVRMEGVDPAALGAREALRLASRYPRKWGHPSHDAPPSVRRHFAAHAAALLALSKMAPPPPLEEPSEASSFRVALAGDCMWLRDTWDGSWLSGRVGALLGACAGGLVANLETPLHEACSPPPALSWRLQAGLPDCVAYSSPAAFADAFPAKTAWSVANNHALDVGAAGARATLAALSSRGMPCSGLRDGAAAPTWCRFERSSGAQGAERCSVGLYAATFGVNLPASMAAAVAAGVVVQTVPGLALASAGRVAPPPPLHSDDAPSSAPPRVDLSEAVAALGSMAAAGVGFRVVSLHMGHEFEGWPTAAQMAVARALVAAGADLVLGAHAHLQHPSEVLLVDGYEGRGEAERAALRGVPHESRVASAGAKTAGGALPPPPPRKALVLYGLGNFCSTMFNELCRVGLLATLKLNPPEGMESGAPWGWSLPEWHWLYNEAAVLRGAAMGAPPRRLLLVRSDCGTSTEHCPDDRADDSVAALLGPRKRRLVDFTRDHVFGGEEARVAPTFRL